MRTRLRILATVNLIGITLIGARSFAANMDSYLEQVKKNNPAYKASNEASQSGKLRFNQGSLLVMPQLALEAAKTVDETEATNPSYSGYKNSYDSYSVSLLQDTTFGLSGKLSFEQTAYLTEGSSVIPAPYDDGYHRAKTSIELSQSLWKNGFGSEVRAQKNLINAGATATYYAERAKNLGIIIEAQNTYYKLYYAKKSVQALKESLDVAEKLKAWAKKRLDQALGEQSDYYQTKAAYELRELEYLNALQAEKTAAREYNSLKGENSDIVTETLDAPSALEFKKQAFSDKIWRDDVRAANKEFEAKKAQSLLEKEKAKPIFDIYGKYGWNGLEEYETDAREEALHENNPAYTVGVRFKTTLAVGKAYDVYKGYEKEALAADLNFKRKAQEQERDYNDLISKIENASQRLKLASTLEESQKIKVQAERKRHGRGRTTFFQVLTFEQDYLTSQLNKIRTEAELNSLLTQLQMYRGE